MKPKVLFTSVCAPYPKILEYSSTDEMAYRLTRGQGLFRLYEHTHNHALHLMAQNLSCASVVLENPTLEQLSEEVEKGYDYVAISFKTWDAEMLLEMCKCIRHESPNSKIIVGGYGVACVPELFKDPMWKDKIDTICNQEGIRFMRQLLDEPVNGEIRCRLPKIGSSLPWLQPRPIGTIGIILSGLGCTYRCPFCVTSDFHGGRYVEVMTAEQIYRAMHAYWKASPLMNSVTIYDENFLDHKQKADELGKWLREDSDFGLRKFNYFAFGSLNAVARYEPEELLLNGADTLWIGVESKFTSLIKRGGADIGETFKMLHSIGIKTVGSWIIGEDFQTPDNINEDIDFFISLDPTLQQVSVLTVMPPLPLWASLKQKGRIPSFVNWKEYHLYGKTFEYKSFAHQDILNYVDRVYERIYEENGPALIKTLDVNLNGYEFCVRSKNPLLRRDKVQYFETRCKSYYPLMKTAMQFAPSERVRKRVEGIEERFREFFGVQESERQEKLSDLILIKAEEEMRRNPRGAYICREEPFRHYTYPPLNNRPVSRPYTVEYPNGDPFLQAGQTRISSAAIA